MKITERQLLILMDVCRHVIDCNIVNANFGYKPEHLAEIYEDILNQQTEILEAKQEQLKEKHGEPNKEGAK